MKNKRQELIFWHIMDHYKGSKTIAVRSSTENFLKRWNSSTLQASVDLITSDRLLDLNLEIRKLNSSMKLEEIRSTRIIDFPTSIKPFWDLWPRVRRILSPLLKLRRP